MATLDKLTTVVENVPKVYHAGQMNIVENADCLKGSKSGSAILIDDVSPVTHEMGVRVRGKNLSVDVSNRTDVFFSGSPTTTYNITGSQLIKGFAVNGYATNYHITEFTNSNGTVTFKTSNVSYTVGIDVKVKSGLTYTVSANITGGTSENKPIWAVFLKDGVFQSYTTAQSFTVPNGCNEVILLIRPSATNTECSFSNIQLELGTSATAYTPYIPDLTAVTVSKYGKNLTNSLTDINPEQNSSVISRDNGIVTVQSRNAITYSSYAALFNKKLPSGTYTFSFDCIIENTKKCTKPNYVQVWVDNKFLSNPIYDMWKDGTYHRSFNFKITKKGSVLIRIYFNVDSITESSDTIITKAAFSNVQLELGSTATDYEPYNSKTNYTPTSDGTVDNVTSLYPNTTLVTDTDGVIIDCDYYKDIDKTFDALTTSVALSGGE